MYRIICVFICAIYVLFDLSGQIVNQNPCNINLADAQGVLTSQTINLLNKTAECLALHTPKNWSIENANSFAQEYLLRQAKERWNVNARDNLLSSHSKDLLPLFEALFMTQAIHLEGQSKIVIVHGATIQCMQARWFSLKELLDNHKLKPDLLFFLTGDRDLSNISISKEEKESLAKLIAEAKRRSEFIQPIQNEADAALLITKLNPFRASNRVLLIRAPKNKDGGRPTTKDTLKCWLQSKEMFNFLKGVSDDTHVSILAISNNPYILQQHENLREVLSTTARKWKIQTIGMSMNVQKEQDRQILLLCDSFARALHSLYAGMQPQL